MSVYAEKRSGELTGRWVAEVMERGKRHKKVFGTRREAQKQEALWKSGIFTEGGPARPRGPGISITELVNRAARSAWKGYKSERHKGPQLATAAVFVTEALEIAKRPLDTSAITSDTLRTAAIRARDSRSLKASSTNLIIGVFVTALRWAEQEGLINHTTPRFPRLTTSELPSFILTDEQERDILAYLEARGRKDVATVMRVQLATGVRIGELVKRTPHEPFKIEASRVLYDGDWATAVIRDGKTGDRPLTMPADLAREYLAVRDDMPGYHRMWEILKAARVALGLPTQQPTHSHRHTVGTRLTSGDVPTAVVKEILGHKNIATTLRYAKATEDTKRRALQKMLNAKAS